MALTGYLPDFDFLGKAGVLLEGESMVPHHNDHTMETNVSGLYLAGVVCGGKIPIYGLLKIQNSCPDYYECYCSQETWCSLKRI